MVLIPREYDPIAILLLPEVFNSNALEPMATTLFPLLLERKELDPTATLSAPPPVNSAL